MIDKRCVVILGAGASVPYGVPAMKDLLTDNMLSNDEHDSMSKAKWGDTNFKEQVKQLREELQTTNVEKILTAVLDEKTNYRIENKEEFKKRIHIFLKHSVYGNISGVRRSNHLKPFFEYCKDKQFIHTAWCSFNWDCIFESAFYYSHNYKNPHLEISPEVKQENFYPAVQNSNHTFLKLHGGINWWWKDSTESTDSTLTFLKTRSGNKVGNYVNYFWKEYEESRNDGRPAILEPITNKYEEESEIYSKLIQPQWKAFERYLRDADTIITVGYSLPDTDGEKVKSILANSTSKFVVFDLRRSVYEDYKEILGQGRVGWLSKPYNQYSNIKYVIEAELNELNISS